NRWSTAVPTNTADPTARTTICRSGSNRSARLRPASPPELRPTTDDPALSPKHSFPMEIPYIVTPRKDTGLFNSKIAIWLFLASEVMLFGGFFSAYVFLRVGADYPWPERTLPVLPGLINTFVLIGSSVTVVFAWAALKLRNWRQFQVYMWITIICAGLFMVLKGIEYNVKFHHQAVRLNDYTVVEGHLGYEKENG